MNEKKRKNCVELPEIPSHEWWLMGCKTPSFRMSNASDEAAVKKAENYHMELHQNLPFFLSYFLTLLLTLERQPLNFDDSIDAYFLAT